MPLYRVASESKAFSTQILIKKLFSAKHDSHNVRDERSDISHDFYLANVYSESKKKTNLKGAVWKTILVNMETKIFGS